MAESVNLQNVPVTGSSTLASSMLSGLSGGIASGLGSLLSTGVNMLFNKQQLNQQKRLIDYQYSKDLEMWQRQNEYNSPLAQMERYRAAGLNPNLVAGSSTSAGNSGSMPGYGLPEVRANHLDANPFREVFDNAIQMAMANQQLKSLKEDVIRKRTENAYLTDSLFYRNEDARIKYGWSRDHYNQVKDAELRQLLARIGVLDAQKGLATSQTSVANWRSKLLSKDLETYDERNLLDGNFFLNTPFIRGRISPMKVFDFIKKLFK